MTKSKTRKRHYFVVDSRGNPQKLLRVEIAGGTSGAVASDACNVYWLTASAPWAPWEPHAVANGPPILMYRRR